MRVLELLEKHLAKYEPRAKESHYPSEADDCVRKLWYKWNGQAISDPPNFASTLRMGMGNAIHEWFARKFEDMGMQVLDEVAFKKNVAGLRHPISGRLDGLFVTKKGEIRGIEIKTTYGRGIRSLRKSGRPKDSALYQILIYFECVNVQFFHLVYIGRDDAYRMEFIFERKDGDIYMNGRRLDTTFSDVIKVFQEIENVKGKEKPERPFKLAIRDGEVKDKFTLKKVDYKSDWQCSYCSYQTECWKDVVKKSKGTRYHGEKEIK